MELPVIKI